VRVVGAYLRASGFDEVFEVADVQYPLEVYNGRLRAQLKTG